MATPNALMSNNIWATSFAGTEIARLQTWGSGPERRMDYELASPSAMCNIPQHVMEPVLLAHARDLIATWVADDNTARPHSALGYQTPAGFALHLTTVIARPAARDESSARRPIAQPAPIGVNDHRAPVVAG